MFLLALGFLTACGTLRLPGADDEVTEIFMALSTAEEAEDADLIPLADQLHSTLLEVYADNLDPVPEEKVRKILPGQSDVELFELFRWGLELPSHSENESAPGALVARPISTNYENHFQLMVNGDWTAAFASLYREHTRIFQDTEGQDFINGDLDRVVATNEVVNTAERGIVFSYGSESVFRRVKGVNTPTGEALFHWEFMTGEAERIEGGYNAYFRFLVSLQIAFPIDEDRSWRVAASWSEAGGSALFIGVGANSGNIGAGIRDVFRDLEEYLANQ